MAAILGDLSPADEGMHEVEASTHFNESALVTYFSRDTDSGALLRIGNRPNEGHAQVTCCLFPPGGGALFQYARAPITGNGELRAGGLRFEVTEPARELRISYAGDVAFFADPRVLADPGPAFRAAPRRAIRLELTATAVSPLYGASSGTSVGGHYEQHMRVDGTLTVDGASAPSAGLGNRDHSWGPRTWHSTYRDRTLWCTFGPDFAIAASLTWPGCRAEPAVTGTVITGGAARALVAGRIESQYEDNGRYHRSFRCDLTDDRGEHYELDGRVVRFIPFRHRPAGHLTHIGQGMTEFTCRSRVAYGLSEYMDLVR
jgi:hypothetical protein